MRKLLVYVLPLCIISHAGAQESKLLADAGIATCDSADSGGGTGSWVASKTGYSAAVELRTKITGAGSERRCATSWRLHVRVKEGPERSITVAEREDRPGDNEWIQNTFEINAWSKDGNLLLTSQIEAQGDWDETTPIVFDFNSNSFHRAELYPLFKKFIRSGCFVLYRPLGFTRAGRVLISAVSTDGDREGRTKACFPETLWEVDMSHGTVVRAAHREAK